MLLLFKVLHHLPLAGNPGGLRAEVVLTMADSKDEHRTTLE